MIFFDTCVWIELFGVRTPEKEHEKQRAIATSDLFQEVAFGNRSIK